VQCGFRYENVLFLSGNRMRVQALLSTISGRRKPAQLKRVNAA